ncbi:HMG domain-containing protein 3 HMG box-containing protein 3 [Takifugu flavidus]|uniref:HMG domain-containing protein 3 HMG box-containing protein 3 n=1 Tax=Takifugu flavidus TaxID=433684 RepID=A0A5C6MKF6_9TELE|nr:HMG domain-containing protein 3 HMG box-containing protein 3 [Takifugu flavidus]
MEKDEVFDIVKVTEEVESYNQSEVATPKKKKSKSQEVCADKPKKPRSAYLLYYFDVHQILQQEASNIPQSEINKRISESWKRLSVAEKAYYLEKAKAEKDGTDRSSPNPSKDVPGYRKILPRADYLLLSKGCSSNQPLGSPESEVCVDSTVDSILPSAAVTQGFTPLGLTSEVEHSEQAAVLGDITEETVLASHPADPQEIASISSSSLTSKAQSSMDTCVDQDPDLAVTVVTLKGNKSVADSGSADSMLLQKLEEPAQMVALIPAQNRLEPTFVPGFSSLSPMMMFSVGSSKEQSISPSYKMATEGRDSSSVPAHKRPVRPILPAYCSTAGRTLVHIFAVPPEKAANNNNRSLSVPQDSFSRLKPSTLKQLGQTVTTTTTMQGTSVPANGSQPVTSSGDRRDLGLSTARGRGRCKNPSCDYMYKNRHKPAVCPKCGCELAQKSNKEANSVPLLDPYQPLSPAQKDTQRHSTLQLLQRSLQIPEGETELQETLTLIQELNSLQIVLIQTEEQQREFKAENETLVESRWPRFYECAATHCSLCNYPLFKGGQSTIAGQEDCWLLTETLVQSVSLQLKVCLNLQCLALHSFTDLHPGLFNVGNKLLVSLDLFLKVRARIKLGHHPTEVTRTILDQSHPVHNLSSEELSQILELLLSGYWAFECLTVRDYNDMICGICGVAPKLEFAQRYSNNVLELKNVEFTWPEYSVSDEVHMDDFWLTMETEAIEQAIFPTDIPITRVDASIIAPFFPPLMRGPTVINTEKDKVQAPSPPSGDPAVLVRLVHDGKLNLDKMEDHTEEELRAILGRCGANITPASTKDELLASLFSLYTFVHSSLPTAPPPPSDLTAGKLSKLCPHKVVCGSKYLVRGETARDHVDLLLSSRYWPPVYISDCARSVALCADMHYSELATKMWGRNQGCFSDPFEKTQVVSCPELQDQPYSADVSLVETHHVHPITKSSSCWLVCSPGAAQEDAAFPSEHHSIHLCRELEPYVSLISDPAEGNDMAAEGKGQTDDAADDVTSERSDACSSADRVRQQPAVFNNPAYYYLYNRLVDFLTSRDIVCQQINKVVQACQPGDVVIRDALCRLGVAQIKTEKEEDGEMKVQTHEGGAETYRVVLPE